MVSELCKGVLQICIGYPTMISSVRSTLIAIWYRVEGIANLHTSCFLSQEHANSHITILLHQVLLLDPRALHNRTQG